MRRASAFVLSVFLPFALAAAPQEPSTHEQAVIELFKVMDLERTMTASATAMIDAQIQNNPAIAPYRDVMLQWAQKYLTWEAMAPQMIRIQMEYFTEAEVREMTAFYRTPTGQKALEKLPEVMKRGAMIGADLAKAHQSELEQMVLERKSELESENEP